MCSTPLPAVIMLLFPVNVRQTGYSISYSIAIGCFGVLTPVIFLWLVNVTKLNISPIFCVDFYALISLYGLYCLKKDKQVIEYERVFDRVLV
ncbi:MAG: hypothetical protein ACTJLM_04315 [Ehrlichia sp.]